MIWLNKHKRVWRIIILVSFLIALIGPWVFEQIHVPAEYACSPPNIRLEGDFCGTPLTGIWIFTAMIGNFFSLVSRLFTGAIALTSLFRELIFTLLSFLLVLPFFTTLLLVLGKDQYFQFQRVGWGLTVGVALLYASMIILSLSINPLKLWGLLLFIVIAAIASILELLAFRTAAAISLHATKAQ